MFVCVCVCLFVCLFVKPRGKMFVRYSFVRLSPSVAAERAQRYGAAAAKFTNDVTDVFSPLKNFTPVKFMLVAGAYSWRL